MPHIHFIGTLVGWPAACGTVLLDPLSHDTRSAAITDHLLVDLRGQ